MEQGKNVKKKKKKSRSFSKAEGQPGKKEKIAMLLYRIGQRSVVGSMTSEEGVGDQAGQDNRPVFYLFVGAE